MDRRFILALSMPIALILVVLFLIHRSELKVFPTQNFAFSLTKQAYCAKGLYVVEQRKLVWKPKKADSRCEPVTTPKLYRYVMLLDKAEIVNIKATKSWVIDPSETSADGFKIESGKGAFEGAPFISYRMENTYYLARDGASKLLQLPESAKNNDERFEFLGWIES